MSMTPSARTTRTAAVAVVVLITAAGARHVRAQKPPTDVSDAPAHLSSRERIAPQEEPGTPLVISGQVVAPDGKTPVPGVTLYGYHTDADGYYRRVGQDGEAGERDPRLRGWAKSDENGGFEFTTIKPSPYPHRNVPAHVHMHAWGAGYPRQWFQLEFAGDPLLPKQHFTDNTADYLYIVPVAADQRGVEHCFVRITLLRRSNFPGAAK
jgi:protocatechuate 3,4-dioxygenase beta subunit